MCLVVLCDILIEVSLFEFCVLFDNFFFSGDKNENILIMFLDIYKEYILGIIGKDFFNCLLLDCLIFVMYFENGEFFIVFVFCM